MLGRGHLCEQHPVKTLGTESQMTSPNNTLHVFLQFTAGAIQQSLSHSSGRGLWKFVPTFLWTLPHLPFPFANFMLYPLTVLNHSFQMAQSSCQCRRCRFDPQVGKIPYRRKWQPTPVSLPRKAHGQRSMVVMRSQRVRHNLATESVSTLTQVCLHAILLVGH